MVGILQYESESDGIIRLWTGIVNSAKICETNFSIQTNQRFLCPQDVPYRQPKKTFEKKH